MLTKLQIYHQPIQKVPGFLESLTVSYSEFDEAHNTYKQKIVLEKGGAKYKIKRYLDGFDTIRPVLENLDLSTYNATDVNPGDAYYYVKFGDKVLATGNADDIRDLLDLVKFDEIMTYPLSEYQVCN